MKGGYNLNYDYFETCKRSLDIDYLRVSYQGFFNYDFTQLDYDNSNFGYYTIDGHSLLVDKTQVKGSGDGYKFIVDFNGNSVPLFMYRLYKDFHLIDFYGSFFRLLELGFLPSNYLDSVLSFLNCPKTANISRIDYRIDFFSNSEIKTPKIKNIIKHSIDISSIRLWKIGQNLTNWQVGDKSSKSVVFRLYDKLLDSSKKGKDFLYFDYFRFASVYRLEFECNQKFCKGYTVDTLQLLLDKIYSVFGISNEKWQGAIFYRSTRQNLYYTREEIDTYLSYISRAIDKISINYKTAFSCSDDIDIKINPLVICYDYLEDSNENFMLTQSQVLDFIDYWKKIKKFNKSKGFVY